MLDYCSTCKNYIENDPCNECEGTENNHVYYESYFRKPMTNVDRIRAMTDVELSQFLVDACACFWDDADVCKKWNGACDKCWLDWLKQEVIQNE